MTNIATMTDEVREKIIAQPDVILEDPDVMQALIAANEKAMGHNIVDLRGIAMERLATRLDRLEDTHRTVIAAAYENLAGTNQIHRAVLRLLDPVDFEDFLACLSGDVADILRVDAARLVLESVTAEADDNLDRLEDVLSVAAPGFVTDYLTRGRDVPVRKVTLRQLQEAEGGLYGEGGGWIRSEACLTLDLGDGRLPAMLALGAEDPHLFSPAHGTDLLTFLAGTVERAIRRWLA
ncbi:MAG: DUF484 family protein [Rhodobacteraceae bacterium]|jgi:hypothetical protein|nr:DUF484 family protein [Alphaproteobacteria bacterium]MBT8474068.1 DUF484 family protein [Alphaproteobacteria bacterium]NNK67518.1 DUF484 family protein [Paracoccaceae bacterium]